MQTMTTGAATADDDGNRPHPPSWWDAVRQWSLRNFLVAVVAGLVAAGTATVLVLGSPAVYASQAALVIDNPHELATAHDDGPLVKLSALRVKYAALAATSLIQAPVAQKLGIPQGRVAEAQALPVGTALTTVVVARDSDPARAQQIAEGVAEELVTYVNDEHERNNVPPDQRFTFTVVGKAFRGAKIRPTTQRAVSAGAAAAVAGMIVVYLLLQVVSGFRRFR